MIFTLVIGLGLAFVLGMLAQKLKLSPLVGYLVAGMLAAQPWWGHPVDQHMVEEFSHIGVVLLLFGVGLHFHFKDLLAVRKVAVPGAVTCSLLWTGIGGMVYYLCGGAGGWVAATIFGMCVCVSSTVVLTRVLEDNRMLQTPAGHTALGWLVVEDLLTIILLVLMPVMFGNDALLPALGGMAVKLTLLVLIVAFLGKRIITRVLTYVARNGSDELFTLGVLVIALGIAVLSSYVFNASMEFGAFLSGMVVGQSKFASRAASDALPMRDAFAVLFFVSVGMGFQMGGLVEYWPLALSTTAYVLLIKPVTGYIVIRMLRRPARLGVVVGGALAQIGEFSFILATLAASTYGVLPLYAANVITGAAIISITLNAALFRYVPRLIHLLEKNAPVPADAAAHVPEPSEDKHRVIVVGYGPSGQIMTGLLRKYDVEVVVLEMNIDTVSRLHKEGIPALHGDARLRHILKLAGVEQAQAIMVTAAAAPAKEIAAAARSLNKDINVMAYTTYMSKAQELRIGGNSVFSGEEEVALSMSSALLRKLGATDEQVNRERIATRRSLAGLPPEELEIARGIPMKGLAATCALLSLSLSNGAWGNDEQSAAGGIPASLRVHSCCVYTSPELESALYEAAEAGQRETVLLLLGKGAPLSAGISGAACGGHRDIVNLLLEKGACPNDGLAGALMGAHADIAEQMLELGADPTEPLWRAAFHDKLDMMRLLLEHGANPDIAIMEAASYMQMDMVKLLLERGADPTHGLSKAALRGNTDMVKLLLEHGADPESGIVEAVREVHADVVAMLHKAGAPLDREKLLPMAVQGGDATIVKTLLEHGTGHVKVLALAVEHGRTSVVKLLLEHGEVPGGYELRSAAQYGYADILKLLLPLTRSEINTANWLGWTPLRLALKRGDCECVRLLLEYGADANETGSQGRSLLDYALQLGHEECASLLRDATGKHGK